MPANVPRVGAAPGLLALSFAVVFLAAAFSSAQSPPPAGVSFRVPVAPAVVVTAGVNRLTYELHVDNTSERPITLTSLTIDTAAPPVPITMRDEVLIRALDPPPSPATPALVPPGGRRVVYVDLGMTYEMHGVPLRPRRVRHRLTARVPGGTDVIVDDGEGIEVDPRQPVVLGPPLVGGPWAAVHHPDWERGHRRVYYTVDGRTTLPGRYTIDFIKLDAQGRTTRRDADVVADSLGYGAEVLAVADATVAAVRDTMPEVVRVSARVKHPQDQAAGNYVSLDLGDGRFAVYEHLKPGSVRVAPGQRVRRGDVVAQLGFTGDSTGPHLHLHIGDAAAPLAAEGQPFVFERFEVLGRYADIDAMGQARWLSDGAGLRQRERPEPNAVIDFGATR
jgi:murein DD-endopeptidase